MKGMASDLLTNLISNAFPVTLNNDNEVEVTFPMEAISTNEPTLKGSV